MENKALVLVDFENEWQDANSDYYIGNLSTLVKRTNKLIAHCRTEGYKIIFIRHVEKDSKSVFAEKSENTKLIAEIDKRKSDTLITKYKISPFYNTSLADELKDVKEIIVCGILTNLCVRSLVNDAYDRDFKITLVSDCCQSTDSEMHDFTLKDIKATRPEVKIIGVEEFIK
jgi:nicotinamidase-related amidase